MAREDAELVAGQLEGELLKGCYRIGPRVGKGGMAWVYKATHTMLLETVAVKVMFAQHAAETELHERFIREAQLQARVKHAHVVHVTDFINERGIVGLVAEWVEGGDLQEWCEDRGLPLPLDDVLGLMLPVLEAVGFAHELGIVHRDLKPANIMLTPTQSGLPFPKLADFGLARHQQSAGVTVTNSSMGTPLYMAPEQFMDAKRVDERADIYSLGVILYQLSSGNLPFQGDLNSLVYQIFQEERTPPTNVDAALGDVILRCIHKSPEARYPSCKALTSALVETYGSTGSSIGTPQPLALANLGPQEESLPSGAHLSAVQEPALATPPKRPAPPATRELPREPAPPRQDRQARRPLPQTQGPSARIEAKSTSTIPTTWALAGLALILLVVGGAAFWVIRRLEPQRPSAPQASPARQTLRSHQRPTAKRPLPPHTRAPKATKPRVASPGTTGAVMKTAAARKVLENLVRTYGGRRTFASIKRVSIEGRTRSYQTTPVSTYFFKRLALFPGHERIELRSPKGSTVQVVSPKVAHITSHGHTKALPHHKYYYELRRKRMLETIEFNPVKMLHSIRLGAPTWLGAERMDLLELGYGGGKVVTLLVSRRNHRVGRRIFEWKGDRYSHYYSGYRFFPVIGTTHHFLQPTKTDVYKNARKWYVRRVHSLLLNTPTVNATLFR